jgi:hypothetical protein
MYIENIQRGNIFMIRKLTAGIIVISFLFTVYSCSLIDKIEIVEIQDSLSQSDIITEDEYQNLEIE